MIHRSQLLTPRLAVRPFSHSDVPELVKLFADSEVRRFVGDGEPLDPETASTWVTRSAENLERFGYGTGAVVERASASVIGWAGFARPEYGGEEIIYGFARQYWRKGFGGELVRALVRFAEEQGMSEVRATVDPDNAGSIALLVGEGFRLSERAHKGDPHSDLYSCRIGDADGQKGSNPK